MSCEQQVIDQVIANWHVAGYQQLLRPTPEPDPDESAVEQLYAVARTCGC